MLEAEQKAYDEAKKRLIDGVNKLFPAGAKVYARASRGWYTGVVNGKAWNSPYVTVRHSRTGKVHHVHYQDVDLICQPRKRESRRGKT